MGDAMNQPDTRRCFDCLEEFKAADYRFAILKRIRDFPEKWQGTDVARREIEALLWEQVFVCRDCAGWYGDHPIELTAEEANA